MQMLQANKEMRQCRAGTRGKEYSVQGSQTHHNLRSTKGQVADKDKKAFQQLRLSFDNIPSLALY